MMESLATTNSTLSRLTSSDAAMMQIKSSLSVKKIEDIENTSKDFEAMFVSEMLGHMFNTTEPDPLFGGGESEKTWRDMMIQEYSKGIVNAGGIGMADSVKAQMISIQEAANK